MSHEVGLLKWITCVVASGRERQFATAQSKWSVISSAPGLVGQFGGWDAKRAGIALIASLWGDRDSYTHFMNEIHDAVTDSNRQSGTYSDIAVEFFRPILSMPGQYQDLVTSVPHGKFLRAADCRVKEERTQHFLEVQTAVWIPAMSRSRGMLGGDFHVDEADESHFLVVTLWDSEENHEKYSRESVPKLRRQADVSKDLVGLIGSAVALENAWKVMGVTPK
ncbi:DUF4937 domain-containing protein [bacterium]|nr:DUF4937 domain-containing protein [bacterium]